MPGEYDAKIKNLTVVDKATTFTVDTLAAAEDFDVIADIEVGSSLNAVINRIEVWASVGNLTQLAQVQTQKADDPNPGAATTPRTQQIRIPFNALIGVNPGDRLHASATLKVSTGVLTNFSDATSETFIFTG